MKIEKRVKDLEEKVDKIDKRVSVIEKSILKEINIISDRQKKIKTWGISIGATVIILLLAIIGAINA